MAEKFTLYHPTTGEKYVTSSKVEATRLTAGHGYTTKAPKQASKSDKS